MEDKLTEHVPDVRKKMTAVEWLEENLIGNPHFESDFIHNRNAFEQAKQMEKEQIRDAWTDGCIGELYELNAYFSSGKYYNTTYESKTDI